jgi:hypothetical protein
VVVKNPKYTPHSGQKAAILYKKAGKRTGFAKKMTLCYNILVRRGRKGPGGRSIKVTQKQNKGNKRKEYYLWLSEVST